MKLINFQKFISKKEVSSVIRDLLTSIKSPVAIKDFDGKVILGVDTGEMQKHPLELGGEVIGWVQGDYGADSIASLLRYLLEREFEKKTLVNDALEKYKEISLLYNFSEKIAACLDPSEISKLVTDQAKHMLKADHISIMLLSEESGRLEIVAVFGKELYKEFYIKTGIGPGQGIAGSVLAKGKSEIVNDVRSDSRYIPGTNKVSSLICAPLKIEDRNIGVINVSSEELYNYTAADLKLLTTLATQAAAALESARLYNKLKETFFNTVYVLAETIEMRDPNTGGHTKRVMNYSLAIGQTMGLEAEQLTFLRLGAILHDIGKIGIRDNVLLKNSKLTDEELAIIIKHTEYGSEILRHVSDLKKIVPAVRGHHERYDGKGYPDNLRGEDISLLARIVAVADSFDAMTSDRPYRKGLKFEVALEELWKYSGTQFDPKVVDAFLKAYKSGLVFSKGGEDGKDTDSRR